MSARDRALWIVACSVVTAAGWALALLYDGMPDLALVILGGLTTGAFGTGLTLAFAVPRGVPAPDQHAQQMQALLEDARRLRADTEKLHRDVVRVIDAGSASGAGTR